MQRAGVFRCARGNAVKYRSALGVFPSPLFREDHLSTSGYSWLGTTISRGLIHSLPPSQVLDLNTWEWVEVEATGEKPEPRSGHQVWLMT